LNFLGTKNDPTSVHKLKTYELINSLKNIKDATNLKRLFSKAHKRTKVLDTPLPKHIGEKAQRLTNYIENKKEISKWDPIVKDNRKVIFKTFFF
jgi:U3 small nucleolar RNA-associated protein 14